MEPISFSLYSHTDYIKKKTLILLRLEYFVCVVCEFILYVVAAAAIDKDEATEGKKNRRELEHNFLNKRSN
jgi:glucuronate isomerase